MSARLIVVDDSDSQIHYSGSGWFRDSGSMDNVGNFGPTYQHSLHGTNSSSSFSFSFQGTSVEVWGTNFPVNTANGVDPSWECFVDNVSIGATAYFQYPENNWLFCSKGQLNDGPHVMKVNVVSNGHTFWFDFIRYAPSASVSTQNAIVSVDHLDPAIVYGSGWAPLGTTATFTNTLGADVTFKFTGTGLSWVSFIPTELSHNPTSATYSIDGGSPVSFPLNGLPQNSATVYNQVFFSVSGLSAGSHSLHVVHGGTSNETPLTIAQILLTDPSSSSSSSSPPSSPQNPGGSASQSASPSGSTVTNTLSPSASNSVISQNSTSILTVLPGVPSTNTAHNAPNSMTTSTGSGTAGTQNSSTPASGNHATPVGAIVGGAVGGLFLVFLVLLCLFLRRRRQKRELQLPDGISPFAPSLFIREAADGDGVASQQHEPWTTATHSNSTSDSSRGIVRKYGNPPVVNRVIYEDSGRRFRQGQLVEDVPPGYSAE